MKRRYYPKNSLMGFLIVSLSLPRASPHLCTPLSAREHLRSLPSSSDLFGHFLLDRLEPTGWGVVARRTGMRTTGPLPYVVL